MKRRNRIYYRETQKTLMTERWKKCVSLQQIADPFGRNQSSAGLILTQTGGIRPASRCRSQRTLSLSEREEVSRSSAAGHSIRLIARLLKRVPSTIGREIKRNGGPGGYRVSAADEAAWDKANRPKHCKLVNHPVLARIVAIKLQLQWSPQQVACWLKTTYPGISSLSVQARGALKKELPEHLRRTRAHAPFN